MTDRPWFKFFPADWRADEALRACSLGARGLWFECLALMHKAVPYGHLLINGKPITNGRLAVLAGASVEEVDKYLPELEEAGVFSRTSKQVIYSRRMTRDEKKAKLARKTGKKGGNPKLSNQKGNPPPDNPALNGTDNGGDKPHIPEAIYQKENNPPSPPDVLTAAKAVVEGFLRIRNDVWPDDPNLPSPTLTLEAQARQYLEDGATPELCHRVFEIAIGKLVDKGLSPPKSLRFCWMSMETEIARVRGNGGTPKTGYGSGDPDTDFDAEAMARCMEKWITVDHMTKAEVMEKLRTGELVVE